jgi:hypothetical protein
MVKSNLIFLPSLFALTKPVLQILLIMKQTMCTMLFLSGFTMGLVAGTTLDWWPWFTPADPSAQRKDESLYQDKPISFWIGRLQDHDPFYRLEAVQALEHIGPKDKTAVLSLAKMLNDNNEGVRIATVLALGRFGSEAKLAIPELIRCLQDRHRYVRVHAVRALGQIAPSAPDVVPALMATLQDDESIVRWAAIHTLGTIGPRAKKALPAIQKAQKDADPSVRQEASDALEKIDHRVGR